MSRTKLRQRKHLTRFPRAYQDCIAIWKAFRQLGFEADDIYFGFGPVSGEPNVVHMQLKTQGKEFTMVVAQLPTATYAVATKMWQEIAALATKVPHEEVESVFREHLLGSSKDYFRLFAAEIMKKGILLPAVVEMMPHAGEA